MAHLNENAVRALFPGVTSVYDTHRSPLREAIARTTGPVLELGMGDGSTPILNRVAVLCDRLVCSYDHIAAWVEKYQGLRGPQHRIELVTSYDDCPIEETRWAVAFVDHAPEGRRVIDLARLVQVTQVIVVHDTEHPDYGYDRIFGLFKYRLDYKTHVPWTSLLSNHIDVSGWVFA